MPNMFHKWQNELQKQTIDKENTSLKIAPKVNKTTKENMVPTLTQWKRWTIEALEEAMDVMEIGQTFLRKISKF